MDELNNRMLIGVQGMCVGTSKATGMQVDMANPEQVLLRIVAGEQVLGVVSFDSLTGLRNAAGALMSAIDLAEGRIESTDTEDEDAGQ